MLIKPLVFSASASFSEQSSIVRSISSPMRIGRIHGDGVAGVDARPLDMLHDAGDQHVLPSEMTSTSSSVPGMYLSTSTGFSMPRR
jgi:hypothetical protein